MPLAHRGRPARAKIFRQCHFALALRLVAALGCLAGADAGAALPPAVQSALREAHIPPAAVAVVIEKLDEPRRGQRLVDENAAQPMNPASVMKLFTTGAALDLLGPASTWKTELRVSRPPVAGVVDGALYFKGSGDPKLNLQQFWLLLRQLHLRGVREIRGDLVIDRSLFALPAHDPAAFDGEGLRPYNIGADAALVNFNALRFILLPADRGPQVDVLLDTPDSEIRIDNRLLAVAGECGDWREKIVATVRDRIIELSGRYPRQCGEKRLNLAPLAGNAPLDGLFRALWSELGGRWSGQAVDGPTPAESLVVATQESPPLTEVVRDINKFSNNVMARQVFLALAATPPASYEKGAARVREWLSAKGIAAPEFRIENGAGLSRRDRVSADTLAATLRTLWSGPTMPEMVASLPVFGEDGTLRKRGKGSKNAASRAHLKTGYIEGVRALAGYVLDNTGQRWSLVALINHPNALRGKEALDQLVEWTMAGQNGR